MSTTRRKFLQLTGAAAALAPTLWIRRVSAAATPAFGQVDHLLILFAKGGLRSHALFNAVGTRQHNPWGAQSSAAQWALGAACGDQPIATDSFGPLPGFRDVAGDVAVLACVDHAPGGVPEIDHDTGSYRIAGGEAGGAPGLLARLGRDHPRYASGFSLEAMPPVEIVPSEFGHGSGDYAATRPIQVRSPADSFRGGGGGGWRNAARQAIGARFTGARIAAYRRRIDGFSAAKQTIATFTPVLTDPAIDVVNAPGATDGINAITNAQLLEVLGSGDTGVFGDPRPVPGLGPAVAQALRFFHFGAPAAVVTGNHFDLHDGESTSFVPRSRDLVRQLAGLRHLLGAMDHPNGGTYWSRTLVAVVSEFSRNNTDPGSGFNSGNGSDHVLEAPDPMRNQAVALMGGAIARPGALLGSTDAEMRATGAVYSTASLLATFCDVLGMSPAGHFADPAIAELFS